MISQNLEDMMGISNPNSIIYPRRKAITAFLAYAACQRELDKQRDMLVCAARASEERGFIWHRIAPLVTRLLSDLEEGHVSLKQDIILLSPHLAWWNLTEGKELTQSWAAAISTIPRTPDIGRCVADTLLLIESQGSLRPHLPVNVWSWLNERPSLPPTCMGRSLGTEEDCVRAFRDLGDIETLTSYLLLVWSEWDGILSGFEEMKTLIKEDFSGIGMQDHRKKLLQRLDYVLEQLEKGLVHLRQYKPSLPRTHVWVARSQYLELREVLLSRESLELALPFDPLTRQAQDPTQRSPVRFPSHALNWGLDHRALHPLTHDPTCQLTSYSPHDSSCLYCFTTTLPFRGVTGGARRGSVVAVGPSRPSFLFPRRTLGHEIGSP